jgi:hypothetical protein
MKDVAVSIPSSKEKPVVLSAGLDVCGVANILLKSMFASKAKPAPWKSITATILTYSRSVQKGVDRRRIVSSLSAARLAITSEGELTEYEQK